MLPPLLSLEVGVVTRNLLSVVLHFGHPRVPQLPPLGLVAKLPDPLVRASHGTDRVVVSAVHQNVQVKAIDKVIVKRGGIPLHVLLGVVDNVAASAPLDVRLGVDRLLHSRCVQIVDKVVGDARVVLGDGFGQRHPRREVLEPLGLGGNCSLDGGASRTSGVVQRVGVDPVGHLLVHDSLQNGAVLQVLDVISLTAPSEVELKLV